MATNSPYKDPDAQAAGVTGPRPKKKQPVPVAPKATATATKAPPPPAVAPVTQFRLSPEPAPVADYGAFKPSARPFMQWYTPKPDEVIDYLLKSNAISQKTAGIWRIMGVPTPVMSKLGKGGWINTADQYAQASAAQSEWFTNLAKDAGSMAPVNFAREWPDAMGPLLESSDQSYAVKQLFQHLQTVYPYMKEQTANQFARAYAHALAEPDPARRNRLLGVVEKMIAFNKQVLDAGRTPSDPAQQGGGQFGNLVAAVTQEQSQLVNQGLKMGNTTFYLTGPESSLARVSIKVPDATTEALKKNPEFQKDLADVVQMFPGFASIDVVGSTTQQSFHNLSEILAIGLGGLGQLMQGAGHVAEDAVGFAFNLPGIKQGITNPGRAALHATAHATVEALAYAGDHVSEAIMGKKKAQGYKQWQDDFLKTAEHYVTHPIDVVTAAFAGIDHATRWTWESGIADHVAILTGGKWDPTTGHVSGGLFGQGDPLRQSVGDFYNFAAQWALFDAVGGIGLAAKAAHTGEMLDIAKWSDYLATLDGPELDAALQNFKLRLNERFSFVQRRVYKVFSQSPTEWVDGGLGTRWFKEVQRLTEMGGTPEEAIGRLVAEMPGDMPVRLAQKLAEAPTLLDKKQAWLNYYKGSPDPVEMERIATGLRSAQAELNNAHQAQKDIRPDDVLYFKGKYPVTDGQPRLLNTGDARWDRNYFASTNFEDAQAYSTKAGTIKVFRAKPEVKILTEGTPEFERIYNAANPEGLSYADNIAQDGQLHLMAKEGGNLVDAAKAEGYDAIAMTDQLNHGTVIMNRDAFDLVGEGPAAAYDPLKIANAKRRVLKYEKRLMDPPTSLPIFQAPEAGRMHLFGARVARGYGSNIIEDFLSQLYRPTKGRVMGLQRFFDLMGHEKLFNPARADAPVNALERNALAIREYGERYGVPKAEIQRIIGKLSDVRSDAEFYRWYKEDVAPMWDRARLIYPDQAQQLKIIGVGRENAGYDLINEVKKVDGVTSVTPIDVLPKRLPDGSLAPQPWMESQFVDHINLPSYQQLHAAGSYWGHLKALPDSKIGSALRRFQRFNDFATATLKPIILVSRVPALIMRQQMEQMLRMQAYGWDSFINPLTGKGKALLATELPEDAAALGLMKTLDGALERPGTMNYKRVRVYAATPDGVAYLTKEGKDGLWWQLRQHNASQTMQYLAEHGPDEFVRWFNEPDQLWLRDRFRGNIESTDFYKTHMEKGATPEEAYQATVKEWARLKDQVINDLTGGREDLRRLIYQGKTTIALPGGDHVLAAQYDDAQGLLRAKSRAVKQLTGVKGQETALRVAQEELLSAQEQADMLATQLKASGKKNYSTVDLTKNRQMFGNRIQTMYDSGTYAPPANIVSPDFGPAMPDVLDRWRSRLYGGIPHTPFQMEVASNVDRMWTRGSLYRQIHRDKFLDLVSRGYSPEEAAAYAAQYAGNQATEIMYDLNAKTSAQLATRNAFYFLPAYQELLTTWLLKAPSSSYWPVGAFALAGKAHSLSYIGKLLTDSGLMRHDKNQDGSTSLAVAVPGLHTLLDKLGLHGVNVSFNPRSLNLVANTIFPGLSTQYSAGINYFAKQTNNDSLMALTQAINGGYEEVSWAPAALTYFWEATVGSEAPWSRLSGSYQEKQYDMAYDTAVQYAMADAARSGQKAPDPSAYPDTDAGKAQYQNDLADWRDQHIFSKADNVHRAFSLIRFLGASIFPAALHPKADAAIDANKALSPLFAVRPKDTSSEAYKVWADRMEKTITGYLADHPGSYAYIVGKTYTTDAKGRPLAKNDPLAQDRGDDFWHNLHLGLVGVLKPEDYINRVTWLENQRWYYQQRKDVIQQISGGDWRQLLTNGFEKHDQLDALDAEHDRWKRFNPEADRVMTRYFKQYTVENGASSDRIDLYSKFLRFLRDVAGSQAADGTTALDVGDAMRAVSEALGAEENKKYAGRPSTDPMQEMVGWWSQHVAAPYYSRTNKLYAEAEKIKQEGGNPGPIYDRIRKLTEHFSNIKAPDGRLAPSPEAVSWGNTDPAMRKMKAAKWASRPISWLTTFQRTLLGYPVDPGVDKILGEKADIEQAVSDYISKQHGTGSGQRIDFAKAQEEKAINGLYDKYASDGIAIQALQLERSSPAERVQYALDHGTVGLIQSKAFSTTLNGAQGIAQSIADMGFDPGYFATTVDSHTGTSPYMLKGNFFVNIDRRRNADPTFDTFMTNMELALGLRGYVAYNALFFNNFSSQFFPQEFFDLHRKIYNGGS